MNYVVVGKDEEGKKLQQMLQTIIKNSDIFLSDIDELFDNDRINIFNDIFIFHPVQRRKIIIENYNYLRTKIHDSRIFVFSIEAYVNNNFTDREGSFLIPINRFPYMDTILVSVCDHCNLNCKGCSHFSPLVDDEVFLDYEQYCKDLRQIQSIVKHTNRINFLGGEPLLNDRLAEYICYAREVFPYANLNLVTNGVLLREMSEELISDIVKTNTKILLSVYPYMKKNVSTLELWLVENGIGYQLLPMEGFALMLHDRYEEFPEQTNEIICSNNVMIQNGKIARCPMYFTVEYYNKKFGSNMPVEDGIFSLYENDLMAEKLHEKLYKPHKLCSYCERYKYPNARIKDWECYKANEEPKMEDWTEIR